MQGCLAEVRARLEAAVARLRMPKWPRAAADAWRPAAVLLARRFGKALRLLRAITAFEGTLARGPLCSLAFNALLPQVRPPPHVTSIHCALASTSARCFLPSLMQSESAWCGCRVQCARPLRFLAVGFPSL